jgi:hypothetical protein
MAALAELHCEAVAAAIRDIRSCRCDLCHTAIGVSFVDFYWACAKCARGYLFQLEMERWLHA